MDFPTHRDFSLVSKDFDSMTDMKFVLLTLLKDVQIMVISAQTTSEIF